MIVTRKIKRAGVTSALRAGLTIYGSFVSKHRKVSVVLFSGLILEKIYHLSVGKNEIFRYIRVSVEEGAGGFHCTYSVKQLFQTTHNSFLSGEGL